MAEDAKLMVQKNEKPSTSRTPKIKGKWTKKNDCLGDYSMEEANLIAKELTNDFNIDLTLPTWEQSCKDWHKFDWMHAEDIVTKKVVCLLCHTSVFEPTFVTHMKHAHPEEDQDTKKMIQHLNEIRLTRYYNFHAIPKQTVSESFPNLDEVFLLDFLKKIGLIVYEPNPDDIEVRDGKGMVVKCPNYSLDYGTFNEISEIYKISKEDATDISEVLYSDYFAEKDIFFPSNVLRRGSKQVFCFVCKALFPQNIIKRHMSRGAYHKHFNSFTKDVSGIFERITEVYQLRYFHANPIPLWKIREICIEDSSSEALLIKFLTERGYVILKTEVETRTEWPPNDFHMNLNDDESVLEDSMSDVSSSSATSASSMSSGIGDKSFAPYSVINYIRTNPKVVKAIYELEIECNLDSNLVMNQTQYKFILGWTIFNLVVSNGCKLNVISSLTDKDFANVKLLNDSEPLRLLSFTTTSTCFSTLVTQWLVLDNFTYDAMKFYQTIRDRGAVLSEGRAHNNFFCSFYMKAISPSDIDYYISQFLRMCNIPWKFRANHLVSSVSDLIVRNPRKTNAEYALDFFKQLSAACNKQETVIGNPENHQLVCSLEIHIQKKIRKNANIKKGSLKRKEATVTKLRPKKRRLTVAADTSSSDDESEENLVQNRTVEIIPKHPATPERPEPAQAFAITPPHYGNYDYYGHQPVYSYNPHIYSGHDPETGLPLDPYKACEVTIEYEYQEQPSVTHNFPSDYPPSTSSQNLLQSNNDVLSNDLIFEDL